MRCVGVLAFLLLCCATRVRGHPQCYFDDRPPDPDEDLTFCRQEEDGACCSDMEEAMVEARFRGIGPLTGNCSDLYAQVVKKKEVSVDCCSSPCIWSGGSVSVGVGWRCMLCMHDDDDGGDDGVRMCLSVMRTNQYSKLVVWTTYILHPSTPQRFKGGFFAPTTNPGMIDISLLFFALSYNTIWTSSSIYHNNALSILLVIMCRVASRTSYTSRLAYGQKLLSVKHRSLLLLIRTQPQTFVVSHKQSHNIIVFGLFRLCCCQLLQYTFDVADQ